MSLRKRQRLTDPEACYAAAAWASGITQRELAAQFGYAQVASICTAIGDFLFKYGPGDWPSNVPEQRKLQVKPAIANFLIANSHLVR